MMPMFRYRAEVRSVCDGDSVRADIDLGCGVWLRNHKVYLHGLDASTLSGDRPEDLAPSDWLQAAFFPDDGHSPPVVMETRKDKLNNRLLATVWVMVRDQEGLLWVNLNESMIAAGYAEPTGR